MMLRSRVFKSAVLLLSAAFVSTFAVVVDTDAAELNKGLSTYSALPPFEAPIDRDTPQKEGYVLLASDEFNTKDINHSLFLDEYLLHWSNGETRPDYVVNNGTLKLRLTKNRAGWDPIKDPGTKVSSIQTYERDDLHRWADYEGPIREVQHFRGHLQKYGHFELRARVARGSGSHTAWWMIGANQGEAEHSNVDGRETGEVDVFEILGAKDATGGQFSVHPWKDTLGVFPTKQKFSLPGEESFADDFHVFEFDWDESGMAMQIDGELVAKTRSTIGYPMLTLLGIYENERGGWNGQYDPSVPYPKEFEIDYFRAYQKQPTLPYERTIADGYLRGNTRSDRWVARWLGGANNDATLTNIWVPKAGEYVLTFEYRCKDPRGFRVLVNNTPTAVFGGLNTGSFKGSFARQQVRVALKEGLNAVSVDNPHGPAPDFGNLTVAESDAD